MLFDHFLVFAVEPGDLQLFLALVEFNDKFLSNFGERVLLPVGELLQNPVRYGFHALSLALFHFGLLV